MRKWIALLCSVVLLCSGCADTAEEKRQTERVYDLYFRTADYDNAAGADAIGVQPSDIAVNMEEDAQKLAEQLMEHLLAGPSEDTLSSPFPAGTSLRSIRISGGRATVDMSTVYSNLSGVALTVADYCITLTLTQLAEIRSVMITVNGQMLAYRGTQTFTARDVLLSSAEDVVAEVDVTLYFADAEGNLVPEQRTLQLYEGDTRAETLVEALLLGPDDKNLMPSLPDGFGVQSVWVKDGRCYVNLSATMLSSLPEGTALDLPIQAAASSLLSLRTVQEVQFLLDAEPAESIGGVDVSRLFTAE